MSKTVATLGHSSEDLWRRLSNEWVHMKGMERLVGSVIEGGLPGYTNIIPVAYGAEDISSIKEITLVTKQFRSLMESTLTQWEAKHRFQL